MKTNTKELLNQIKNGKLDIVDLTENEKNIFVKEHKTPDTTTLVDNIILIYNGFETNKEKLNVLTKDYNKTIYATTSTSIAIRNQYHNLVIASFNDKKRIIKFRVPLIRKKKKL